MAETQTDHKLVFTEPGVVSKKDISWNRYNRVGRRGKWSISNAISVKASLHIISIPKQTHMMLYVFGEGLWHSGRG